MAKFPARLPRSRERSQPALSYELIENFTKDLEVIKARSRKPGQPGQPGSYEEAQRKFVVNVFKVSRMSGQVPKLGLKYWKLRAPKLTLHLINVAEINVQQNQRDLN